MEFKHNGLAKHVTGVLRERSADSVTAQKTALLEFCQEHLTLEDVYQWLKILLESNGDAKHTLRLLADETTDSFLLDLVNIQLQELGHAMAERRVHEREANDDARKG